MQSMSLIFRTMSIGFAVLLSAGARAAHVGDSSRALRDSRWLMDWEDEGRKVWYLTPQGSMFAPMDIFLALRTGDGRRFFAARSNLETYGWAYPPESDKGRYTVKGLPLGFSVEADKEKGGVPAVGFTCAACHTGQLVHRDVRYVIDGGQTLANVQAFNEDLTELLAATYRSPAKIAALRNDIALQNPSSPYARDSARLLKDLGSTVSYLQGRQERNAPRVAYGNGRIDAFSEILNEVLVDQAGLDQRDANGRYLNGEAPASPISLPVLWTVPELDCVQTNCISRNPLSRNLGETLGVFGRARLRAFKHRIPLPHEVPDALALFQTSADLQNLYRLEESLAHLPAPKWPEAAFGPLDQGRVAEGAAIYQRRSYVVNGAAESCASCHVLADRDRPESLTETNALGGQFFRVTRWEPESVGTDTRFLDQQLSRTVENLPPDLAALYDAIANQDKPLFERFNPFAEKSAIKFLAVTTNIAVKRFFLEKGVGAEEQARYVHLHENATTFRPRVYKARPLNGIAFSAPYLHNGSVPTLVDLLKKPSERPQAFTLGTLEWDPQTIGYRSGDDEIYDYGRFTFDAGIYGNGNQGHVWGSELPSHEKDALIEYLKSL